jgi:hypothetical protein
MIPRTDHVADRADDYLHDLLDAADADYVERHCAGCPACDEALAEARKRLAALHTVPPSEASEQLVNRTVAGIATHDQVRHQRRRRRLVLGGLLGTFAAAAAILLAFSLHYDNLAPSPTDLKVLGQTELLADAAASLRVCLIDHQTGQALAGVPVRLALRHKGTGETVELARFTTDGAGTGQPRFRVPDWADADCELQVTADAATHESVAQSVMVRRERQVMLSSDKPVYQPGQTIHVRSLALRRPDLRPVAAEDATFTVTDPKGNIVFKHVAKTSAYGIASADCELDTEILEGQYVVACTVGDTPSRLAVEVQKYVLPRFKVGLTLDRPYYAPEQKVTATVEAGYFFGKPVAGAVQLVATAPGEKRPLYEAGAKTNDDGRAVFTFDLPLNLRDRGDFSLALTATVTDTAGQKQVKTAAALVTTSPLKIEVFPEGGTILNGIRTTVYVFTSYADGRPARATVKGPEGVEVRTDDLGFGSFDYTATGDRLVDFDIRDDNGVTSRKSLQLPVSSQPDDFVLRTDKPVYGAGDTMNVSALSRGTSPIFVDLIRDGQTVLTGTISPQQGVCALDLPPQLSGVCQLQAYRLSPNGVIVQRSRLAHVRPAKGLQVKATTDQAEYRPGRKARLSFALTDQTGRPVRGALSLAAVDEAVFSVLPQLPGAEMGLLRPELTAKLPPAERARAEQALLVREEQPRAASPNPRATEELHPSAMTQAMYPLSASTYTAKSQQVKKERHSALQRVKVAWIFWAACLALAAYVLRWVYVRPWYAIGLVHVVGIMFLCGGLEVFYLASPKYAPADSAAEVRQWAGGADMKGATSPDEVRQDFPETLLWRPELITDDDGRATLDIDRLADSITTWRLTASAVTADGRLGATQAGIRVFQPFFVDLNLPVALTRGDEVTVPVVVYSYLDKPQTVELTLAAGDWFESADGATKKVELGPRQVRSASYRLRVKTVGRHPLSVTAKAGGLTDAVQREVEVVPNGRRVEEVSNGSLAQPADLPLTVPENAVEGSAKVLVKIYPSSFSQLVEGIDGILHMPYGCFEQTSSTTYPNVLALAYLNQTGGAASEVRVKAEHYIHLGYQRLLTFEVRDGGFDWFGRPPANRTLTAYGLMEFQDMAKVYPVDPKLIERTRAWLLKQRNVDGSWDAEKHAFSGDPGMGRGADLAKLSTTAYIAWAVFADPEARRNSEATRQYLVSHKAETIDDPYVLALVANALNLLAQRGDEALPYLDRLEALKKSADDGRLVYWEQPAGGRTAFYGAGRGGNVETTALAALALLHGNRGPETTRRALAWLVKQKDAAGTWPSTQATVLALKALVAGTGKPAGAGERRITLAWDGGKREVVIPADQAEVMKQIDLSAGLKAGTHRLTLTETSGTAAGYQVSFRYHVPDTTPKKSDSLDVRLAFDRTQARVGETVEATATVTNRMKQAAPMVVLELPIPAGFAFESDRVPVPPGVLPIPEAALLDPRVEKYEVKPGAVVVYARGLEAGASLEFTYALRATTPVKVAVPPARAYEYYDPEKQGTSAAGRLTAVEP